jgi:hypothetical protein
MRKYKYLLGVLAITLVSSCSNDDIAIESGKEFTLNVQPASVIANIGEYKDGDMYDFGSEELRVRSLIYNNEGQLVDYEIGYFGSYQVTAKFLPRLPQGTYTVLTTTDFVKNRVAGENQKFGLQFWALKDSTKLKDVYIENTGYIGEQYGILGVDISKITVTSEGGSAVIKPEMNGSLIQVVIDNPHTQFDGKELYSISFSSMENDDKISFSGGTALNSFVNSNEYQYRHILISPSDFGSDIGRIYGYIFQLATDKCHYAFIATTQDNKGYADSQYSFNTYNYSGELQTTFSLVKGQEYVAYWDLEDYQYPCFFTYEEVWGTSSSNAPRRDVLKTKLPSDKIATTPVRYYPFK